MYFRFQAFQAPAALLTLSTERVLGYSSLGVIVLGLAVWDFTVEGSRVCWRRAYGFHGPRKGSWDLVARVIITVAILMITYSPTKVLAT